MNNISQIVKVTIARADAGYQPFVMTALVELSSDFVPRHTDRRVRQMADMMSMDTEGSTAPAIYDRAVAMMRRVADNGMPQSGFYHNHQGIEFQIAAEVE